MYKAIKEIGEYKIGEEIPSDKALVWMKMYAEPHIEFIEEDSIEETKISEKSQNSSDVMLDDYMARSSNVVKKNISKDDLSKDQLEKLLILEKQNKNRSAVISAINKKLSF